jgi:Aminopeptidase P, N-terminal domain
MGRTQPTSDDVRAGRGVAVIRAVCGNAGLQTRYNEAFMVDFSPFIRRRWQLLAELDGGVLVAFAAAPTIRNNDVTHEFRQDSDFHYFEDAVLIDSRLLRALRMARCEARRGATCPRVVIDGAALVHEMRRRKNRAWAPGATRRCYTTSSARCSTVSCYRGIGVRIEDEVSSEAFGARVLSLAVPRDPADVERACRA